MDRNVKMSETELRTIVANIACRAANTNGGSYSRFAEKIFERLQRELGERFDFESERWFTKSDKPSKLKWGVHRVP